jgi:polymorphic membrane protein
VQDERAGVGRQLPGADRPHVGRRTSRAIDNFDYLGVADSTFTSNTATKGGAINNNWGAGVATSSFRDNHASADGGAINNQDDSAQADFGLTDSTLTGNTSGGYGGAITNSADPQSPAANLDLTGTTIQGNTASTDGGGIYNDQSNVGLWESTVQDNQPDNCAPVNSILGCTN